MHFDPLRKRQADRRLAMPHIGLHPASSAGSKAEVGVVTPARRVRVQRYYLARADRRASLEPRESR